MILGIDEAGRGPAVGPLVLCGVWLSPRAEAGLKTLGVRDSKAFGSTETARARREQLAHQIREVAAHVTVLVADAAEVDRRVERQELNQMEQELARAVIESGPPARRIVADGARLFGPLCPDFPRLRAVDHADATCLAVAAASILAKVERDARYQAIIDPLQQALQQPIQGGGYANAATAAFLRAHARRFGRLPDEVRRSWTWDVIQELDPTAGLPLVSRLKHK